MRTIELSRDEAEWLVDLLEDCDPFREGAWRALLAAQIRDAFGMCSMDESRRQQLEAGLEKLEVESPKWHDVGLHMKALHEAEMYLQDEIADDPCMEERFGPMLAALKVVNSRFK